MAQPGRLVMHNQLPTGPSSSPPSFGDQSQGPAQGLAMLLQALAQTNQRSANEASEGRQIQATKDLENQRSGNRIKEDAAQGQVQQGVDKARITTQTDEGIRAADAMNPINSMARNAGKQMEFLKSPEFAAYTKAIGEAERAYDELEMDRAQRKAANFSKLASDQFDRQKALDIQANLLNGWNTAAESIALQNGQTQLTDLISEYSKRSKELDGVNASLRTMASYNFGAAQKAAGTLLAAVHKSGAAVPPEGGEDVKFTTNHPQKLANRPSLLGEGTPVKPPKGKSTPATLNSDAVGLDLADLMAVENTGGLPAPRMDVLLGALTPEQFAPYEREFRTAFASQFDDKTVNRIMGLMKVAATGQPPEMPNMEGKAPAEVLRAWQEREGLVNGDAVVGVQAALGGLLHELDKTQRTGRDLPVSKEAKAAEGAEEIIGSMSQSNLPLDSEKYNFLRGLVSRAYTSVQDSVAPSTIEQVALEQRLRAFEEASWEAAGDPRGVQQVYLRTRYAQTFPVLYDLAKNGTPEAQRALNDLKAYVPETFSRLEAEMATLPETGGIQGLVNREAAAALQETGTMMDAAETKAAKRAPTDEVVKAAKSLGGGQIKELGETGVGPNPFTDPEIGEARKLEGEARQRQGEVIRGFPTPEASPTKAATANKDLLASLLTGADQQVALSPRVGQPAPDWFNLGSGFIENITARGRTNLNKLGEQMQSSQTKAPTIPTPELGAGTPSLQQPSPFALPFENQPVPQQQGVR